MTGRSINSAVARHQKETRVKDEVVAKVAASVPPAYLVGFIGGIQWDKIAAFLACVWTLGLMWKAWIWTPFVKPWLERRKRA